jgi:protein-S-isoprenylcysteine O-methyltransferase Ste14
VRVLVLLLVLLLSAAVAVSAAGALVEGLDDMPSLVTVFFVLDLLLAALVLLTFGRRDRRPARRRGTPARR